MQLTSLLLVTLAGRALGLAAAPMRAPVAAVRATPLQMASVPVADFTGSKTGDAEVSLKVAKAT